MKRRYSFFACLFSVFAYTFACAAPLLAQPSPQAQAEPSPSGTPPAEALYDAAYDRWKALPMRAFATYVSHIEVTRKNRIERRIERIAYRRSDNICLTVGVPLDERDRPDAPSVTDRCLAPDYSFTFVPQRAPGHGGGLPVPLATPGPQATPAVATIGHVVVRTRPYDVAFAGDELIGGTTAAHLVLRPVVNPERHILRDLWIDRATNGVVRLHGVAPLVPPLATVDFTADYAVGPQSETLSAVRGFAKAQLLLLKIGADFTFEHTDVAYPESLPDWYFEKNGYAEHARAAASPAP
jgi:hypothetical protein